MSDDRNFRERHDGNKRVYKTKKTVDDKKNITDHAMMITYSTNEEGEEIWIITFDTKYGHNDCIYNPATREWKKRIGKAKGRGSVSMLKYFRPEKLK